MPARLSAVGPASSRSRAASTRASASAGALRGFMRIPFRGGSVRGPEGSRAGRDLSTPGGAMSEPAPAPPGVLLSDDLIFTSRIVGTARGQGLDLVAARTADGL